MAAEYTTELEALNALCDKTDALATKLNSVDSHVDGLEGQVQAIQGYVDGIEGKIDTTNSKLTDANLKLDTADALLEGLRGAVVDVKNLPTDACIIRVYVGDQTNKRNAAARELTRLLSEGYRPYETFGISEDLARVLFVKYPAPNEANVTP